ncbi:hypothetical protein BH24CHL8_BH24CHL8_07740 [soil metagenome]
MAQWRDERDAGAGSIEELGSAARPARVGSSTSARIPALIVGTLLVGVVAVGVAGRSQAPRIPAPPAAAASTSPALPASTDQTPRATSSSEEPSSPTSTPDRRPLPRDVPLDLAPGLDLRFWFLLVAENERLLRADLTPDNGFYQSVPIDDSWGDGVRARIFGRLGDDPAMRLTDTRVPSVPEGSLDLPLRLDESSVDAVTLGALRQDGRLDGLVLRVRLEQGRGRPGPTLLIVEAVRTAVIQEDAAAPESARDDDRYGSTNADYDRALASRATREALARSPRCARMLDPRLGRSEANLMGCERALMRAGTAGASIPPTPIGATYWLDLRLDGEAIALQALDAAAEGAHEAFFPYPESWYVRAPVLSLYGHSKRGASATIATLQLSKGTRGQPGIPVELAHGPVQPGDMGSPIWIVTLTRGQPHGLAVLVQVLPADLP